MDRLPSVRSQSSGGGPRPRVDRIRRDRLSRSKFTVGISRTPSAATPRAGHMQPYTAVCCNRIDTEGRQMAEETALETTRHMMIVIEGIAAVERASFRIGKCTCVYGT